jgi:hypothetical protein
VGQEERGRSSKWVEWSENGAILVFPLVLSLRGIKPHPALFHASDIAKDRQGTYCSYLYH